MTVVSPVPVAILARLAAVTLTMLAAGAICAAAQPPDQPPGQRPGLSLDQRAAAMEALFAKPRPPLLFREVWKQPPYSGELTDAKRRITQAALTNPNLQLQLYGTDARDVEVWKHEGRYDLWNGLTTSPVAVTLQYKGRYLDLTGLARLRWITRTEDLHVIHPVVRLADGTLLVGSHADSSQGPVQGEFLETEMAFDNQRWFELDPARVVTTREVKNPDLSKVLEIGFTDLMPGGGHGFAGCINVADVQLYATTHPR
ncbi:MAG TPA: hypothetical protein VHX52_10085 [Steroidobacteraceae bacterium]|nr:hypothetical protein [Steroidobacteraceae bacterium]